MTGTRSSSDYNAIRYACTAGFMDVVLISRNDAEPYSACVVDAGAVPQQSVMFDELRLYSLFDFIVVYNGSKLRISAKFIHNISMSVDRRHS